MESRADELLREGSPELNRYVGRAMRTVEKSRMQSNAANANSNRIHSSSEAGQQHIDDLSEAPLMKGAKLRGADHVERNDHAKRDGEVPVEAFNASRSMEVMGVNLRLQYENSIRCDKPSVTNLVSNTEVPP